MALSVRVWRVLKAWIRVYLAKARVSIGGLFAVLQRLLGALRSLSNSVSNVHQPSQHSARTSFVASSDPHSISTVPNTEPGAILSEDVQTSTSQGTLSLSRSHAPRPVTREFEVDQDPANGSIVSVSSSAQSGTCPTRPRTIHTHWSSHSHRGLAMKPDLAPADWETPLEPLVQAPLTDAADAVDGVKLIPIISSDVNRYGRISMRLYEDKNKQKGRQTLNKQKHNPVCIIDPVTLDYQDHHDHLTACAHAGWIRVVHPEGAVYWFHEKKRVFTDAPLWKRRYLEAAALSLAEIQKKVQTNRTRMPRDAELVLELKGIRECQCPKQCGFSEGRNPKDHYTFNAEYYFVSHENRRLFWLDTYDASNAFADVDGVMERSHIGLAIEHEYWQHCEFFPHWRPVPKHIVCEVMEIIYHYMAEMITSDTSLTPFNTEELMQIRESVQYTQGVEGQLFEHSICILSRVMRTLTRNRFFHFHGQVNARLNSDQALFEPNKTEETMLFGFFMICLFNAPRTHLKRLRSVWIDKIVNQIPWRKFIDALNNEWKGYTLYSTVLLTVNLSLLALFNVMPQNSTSPHPQTTSEILCYVSTTCSVGSVMTSLILVRQNETNSRESIDEAVRYLKTVSTNSEKYGIEMLAIIYSLPFGFLLWGLLFFSMAFLALAFQDTLSATQTVTAIATTLTAVLVLWPLFIARKFLRLQWWMDLFCPPSHNEASPAAEVSVIFSPECALKWASSPNIPPSGAASSGSVYAAPPAVAQSTASAHFPNGTAASLTRSSTLLAGFFDWFGGKWAKWRDNRIKRMGRVQDKQRDQSQSPLEP